MKRILVTGGYGFIGSNFVRHMLSAHPDIHILNFDKLTYAGNRDNLRDIESRASHTFIQGDIADFPDVKKAMKGVAAVVHIAAETHVDRSIAAPADFIRTNLVGTFNLLECALKENVKKFIHISTDEVYGSLGPKGAFTEKSPIAPNSPYSASKAGSDMLVRSYLNTYKLPAIITRCSNNYGPYQFPEKLMPLMITNALKNKKLPVYGDGQNIRDWLYVKDHCRAIDTVLNRGEIGEVYNIGGGNEWKNIDVVKLLLKKLNKPESLIDYVPDRPGHDRRYAMDATKIKTELGWEPATTFEQGMELTIQWYLGHPEWLERIKTGAYRKA